MKPAFAVHGGAWNIPDALWPAHQDGCARAYRAGWSVLDRGGSAVDAVAAAIRILEDDPTFDAGYGSFLNEDGAVELDAGLMEGRDLKVGSVVGVSRLKNPIDLAMHVMNHSEHCIYTGEGAHRLAEKAGMQMVDPEVHVHPRERETLARIKGGDVSPLTQAWHDTVGAVALDQQGDLAAGNSTGGVLNKDLGRVGDAPFPILGFYADNERGAYVCTGWGEPILRSAFGMQALSALAVDDDPQLAAEAAVTHLAERVGGFGGLLLLTPDGRLGVAHNTQRMAYRLEHP